MKSTSLYPLPHHTNTSLGITPLSLYHFILHIASAPFPVQRLATFRQKITSPQIIGKNVSGTLKSFRTEVEKLT